MILIIFLAIFFGILFSEQAADAKFTHDRKSVVRRSSPDIIGNAIEYDSVFSGIVATDPSDEHLVSAVGKRGKGTAGGTGKVEQNDTFPS